MTFGLVLNAMIATTAGGAPAAPGQRQTAIAARLQHLINDYVARRAGIEGISGVALRVEHGASEPAIAVYAGNDGLAGQRPISGATRFQIGSNTKHFTAALILKLEADGKLSIDDPIGRYLPQYPAWKAVTIRALLNMTSRLPNYTETAAIGKIIAADPAHQFSDADLIAAVYPGSQFPKPPQWFYSNTNNILAAMIIEATTHMTYRQALNVYLFKPLHLNETFYPDGPTPADVVARLPRGLYENHACLMYQPEPCTTSTLAPLIGKDMRAENLSWAGAAGAIISTPRDLAAWVRALFGGQVLPPRQLAEMKSLVATDTGLPVADVDATHKRAFGLDIVRVYDPAARQTFWFYQGETLGYRAIFAYWPQYDLLVTGATNSQPPDGQDEFGKTVIARAAAIALARQK